MFVLQHGLYKVGENRKELDKAGVEDRARIRWIQSTRECK